MEVQQQGELRWVWSVYDEFKECKSGVFIFVCYHAG